MSERVRHSLAVIIRFRMMTIACGYEDGNDADSLPFELPLSVSDGTDGWTVTNPSRPTGGLQEWRGGWSFHDFSAAAETFLRRHRLSITEDREKRTLSSVAVAGAAIVHRSAAGEIAGATAQALQRKGFVRVIEGSPRRAFLTEEGRLRLEALTTNI